LTLSNSYFFPAQNSYQSCNITKWLVDH